MILRKSETKLSDLKVAVIAFVLLLAYLFVIFVLQSATQGAELGALEIVLYVALSVLISLAVVFFGRKLAFWRISREADRSLMWGIAAFAVTFACFMIYFAGQYPGGISADSVTQYKQAIGDTGYSNWHPVLQTLLFFTIPLALGGSYALLVFLQLLYFCLAFGYLVYVMRKNRCPRWALIVSCVFVCINPYLATYFMYPWKDIATAIFAVILVAYMIQILGSKGEWLAKWPNRIAFSVVAVTACFMRHNAILFVIPLVAIALFYALKDRKTRLILAGLMLCAFASVQVTYAALNVEAPSGRVIETVGLPVSIWGNVMQKNPEALPEETQEVMHKIAPQKLYESMYVTGYFNSIKYDKSLKKSVINDMSYGEVLEYTRQCFAYAPTESWQAFATLTGLVWGIDNGIEPKDVAIVNNAYGVESSPVGWAQNIVDAVKGLAYNELGRIVFGSYGLELLLMFIVAMVLLAKGRKSFIHILPLFCYDFGTMLLLSGPDYRFFLLTIPLFIPTIFLMLKDDKAFSLKKNP